VGIITLMDVLRFLCSATGVARGGPQFAFRLATAPGPLAALLDDLRGRGLRLLSVLTCYDHAEAGFRHAYVRLQDTGGLDLAELTEDLRSRYDLLFRIADGQTVRFDRGPR
jgi:acetoin utilization protein AcuB